MSVLFNLASSSSHDLSVALGGFGGPTVFPCPARGLPETRGSLHRRGSDHGAGRRQPRPRVDGLKMPSKYLLKENIINIMNIINPVILTKTTMGWKWWRSQVGQSRSWVGGECREVDSTHTTSQDVNKMMKIYMPLS